MCDCTCDVSCMSAVQVCAAAESKRSENVTVIKMTPTSSFQPAAPVQKTAVVKLVCLQLTVTDSRLCSV